MTHTTPFHFARGAAALCLALAAGLPAQAQTSGTTGTTGATGTAGSGMRGGFGSPGHSLLPCTSSGYVGLNLGKPDWQLGCTAGFRCSESLRVFRSCPRITPKRPRSSLQMLAIARAMAVLCA